MKVMVASEAHFIKAANGRIYTNSVNGYEFWQRYLDVFNEVQVIARVKKVDNIDPKWILADGNNVIFNELPDYRGANEYFRCKKDIKRIIAKSIDECDRFILRVPGFISSILYKELKKRNKAYAVEVVGDPWESLAPGTIKSISRPIARFILAKEMKEQCKNAQAISYVTKYVLQKRYKSHGYSTNYSSIQLKKEQIIDNPRTTINSKEITLVNVGSMSTLYKSQHIQIKAVKACIDKGYNIKLKLIGDGAYKDQFKKQVKEFGIEDNIEFLGMLPGNHEVMKEIDKSDIFILPSMVEGLPRAMIEAMARGIVCIGTNVGGIPELLSDKFIIPKKNYKSLVNKIIEVISLEDEEIRKISYNNINIAKEYIDEELNKKRRKFYEKVKTLQ